MQYTVAKPLPNYCPIIDETTGEARNLDLSEMRRIYPMGFICCGRNYGLQKFPQFRNKHMKNEKHKKNILDPATKEYRENLGDCDTLLEAFQKKCKENKELKKLNLQKQNQLDRISQCNIELQEDIKELKKKIKPIKLKVKEANLIDLLN